jgi:hypothetical protein
MWSRHDAAVSPVVPSSNIWRGQGFNSWRGQGNGVWSWGRNVYVYRKENQRQFATVVLTSVVGAGLLARYNSEPLSAFNARLELLPLLAVADVAHVLSCGYLPASALFGEGRSCAWRRRIPERANPTLQHFSLSLTTIATGLHLSPKRARALSPISLRPPRPHLGRACSAPYRPRPNFPQPHRHPVTMPASTMILSRVGSQLSSRGSIALRGSLLTSSRRTPALAALARYYACEQPPS